MRIAWSSRIAPAALILSVFAAVAVAYHPWQTERESDLAYAFGLGKQAAQGGANEAKAKFDSRFRGDKEARGAYMKGMLSVQNANARPAEATENGGQ